MEYDNTTDGDHQRAEQRDSLLLVAPFRIMGTERTYDVRVRNLSERGLMIESPHPIEVGTAVAMEVRGIGAVQGKIAWYAEGRAGVALDHTIDPKQARKPVGGTKPS